MFRAVRLLAGVLLASEAIHVATRLYEERRFLMLAGASPAILAALALGFLLVLRALKRSAAPPET